MAPKNHMASTNPLSLSATTVLRKAAVAAALARGLRAVGTTPPGEERFDFLIFGTGFYMDIGRRP